MTRISDIGKAVTHKSPWIKICEHESLITLSRRKDKNLSEGLNQAKTLGECGKSDGNAKIQEQQIRIWKFGQLVLTFPR